MADLSAIGKELPPFTWEVERGKIRELVRAIGDENLIYKDKGAAIKAGYQDSPAPPTYMNLPFINCIMFKAIKEASINFARVLHGEETYEYLQEIYPGDVLTGRLKIANITQKAGKAGAMDFVTVEIMYINQNNEPVMKARTNIVERK